MKGDLHSPKPLTRWKGSQRRIGLTGGISSGKSSVGTYLRDVKTLPIIDADIYAKKALSPNSHASNEVLKRYGSVIIKASKNEPNAINRSALSKIIFNDQNERLWLENLVHPLINQQINAALDEKKYEPIIILIIPLLFEKNLTGICSETWVIYCTPEQQLNRLMNRDKLTKNEAGCRIKSQFSLAYKSQLADTIIDNTGQPEAWIDQVEKLV